MELEIISLLDGWKDRLRERWRDAIERANGRFREIKRRIRDVWEIGKRSYPQPEPTPIRIRDVEEYV